MQNEALKLLIILLFSSFVAFTSLKLIYILPLIFLSLIERKHFIKVLKKLLLLNIFTLFLVIFVAFENFLMALELFGKINLILLFTLLLFSKSKGYDIIRGLSYFKVHPLFISLFYFTLKMIEFLTQEIKELRNRLKSRGFKANTSLFAYETFGNVFALMLIKAIKKSEELTFCMKARGYKGQIYLNQTNAVNKYDIILTATVFVVILI